jgi:lactate racemase
MTVGVSDPERPLAADAVAETLRAGLRAAGLDGERVLVLVPDGTRSMPLGTLFGVVHDELAGRVRALDVLVATGTHQPMSDQAIARRLGQPDPAALAARFPGVRVRNHRWSDPDVFVTLNPIGADELAELTGGRMREEVPLRVNRLVTEYDTCLVLCPVFPHEVVGFSGGNKYFFPGVSGPEMIDVSHWLGALITSAEIIGRPGVTPVRALIDRAAAAIPARRLAVTTVVSPHDTESLHALHVGPPEAAWAAAAEVSARVHVRYLDRPVDRVISVLPRRYEDLWTAAKGMYKVEPVVADGGEVVLVAPHVRSFSVTHERFIRRVGYHCRDYFVAQPERFADVPRAVLAHSTHLRGAGSYDRATGTERCRLTVTLASAVPAADCEAVNLRWRDPATVDMDDADDDTLVVPRAGEVLYRLGSPDGVDG